SLYCLNAYLTLSLFHLLVSFCLSALPSHLLSFPTRRSSDLHCHGGGRCVWPSGSGTHLIGYSIHQSNRVSPCYADRVPHNKDLRSEEHTSELQSRFDLVCRLLLEKKNA